MAFGMQKVPSTFHQLVNQILEGVAGCETYLDNVVAENSLFRNLKKSSDDLEQ